MCSGATPSSNPTVDFGFTAITRDVSKLTPAPSKPIHKVVPASPASTPIPSTALAKQVQAYALKTLPAFIYHHSMRVYHYGISIREQQFPDWKWNERTKETYFLTCMLHDVGLTQESLRDTKLSFEFWGGYNAMEVLLGEKGERYQAESVAEAIIRHNDFGPEGLITSLGLILQMATTFDNMGNNAFMVHPDTIKSVVKMYPRLKWNSCVVDSMKSEFDLKPWAHLTKFNPTHGFFEEFIDNKVMEAYDEDDSGSGKCPCGH
ncbi:hypothetical protein CEP54_015623 [Fusarium duplospermum]|uniref:Cyanamide hydratase n=1 Tax=Fusarium duplospermum TaxID=1325734 RepID=A0A428NMR8_9HYPO|nr:hypothetical protein CEP54_015623 [Fusarium duplospermum]